jgi:hypothetical protein
LPNFTTSLRHSQKLKWFIVLVACLLDPAALMLGQSRLLMNSRSVIRSGFFAD